MRHTAYGIRSLGLALSLLFSCSFGFASSFVLLSRDQLVSSADAVVQGRISSIQSTLDDNGNIDSFIAIEVARDFLRGLAPGTTIYLREPGGKFQGVSGWAFGAPEFEIGEDVVVFLKLHPNGFFRVAHLFQGKFAVLPFGALRQERPDDVVIGNREVRRFATLRDIEERTRATPTPVLGVFATELEPAGWERFSRFSLQGVSDTAVSADKGSEPGTKFNVLTLGGVRWHDFDAPVLGSVTFRVNPTNSPLGSTSATLSTVDQALQAWNTISGARISLVNGGTTALSGRDFNDGVNVITFNDPQEIIQDPVGCSGTLAVAYIQFFSAPNKVVNGVNFRQLIQADIVFNDNFSCVLGIASSLAEVCGHEVGHTLGFGHSSENPAEGNFLLSDALMYFRAHGDGRGASVRTDDVQLAQFVYPSGTLIPILISGVSALPFVISPNGDSINDLLTFQFTITGSNSVTVEILDRNGTAIAQPLVSSSLSAGTHTVAWNGITSSGWLANDGMYTFRIRGNSAAAVTGSFGVNNTIPEVSTSWFLAEGSTVGFEAYALVQNPNFSPVTVDFTFFRQDGTTKLHSEVVPARTRLTVPIHDPIKGVPGVFSVSTRVTASLPIIVERAMYFSANAGAHNSSGAIGTNRTWYFPANYTFLGEEDFILIVNPSASSATTVTATFFFESQAPSVQSFPVAANSRFTIPVHGVTQGNRVSVRLESTLPIAAERAYYINNRIGGAGGIGAVSTSQTWYFAEGDTSSLTSLAPVTARLEMFNPGFSAATVTVNYMLESGTVIPRTYTISAERRLTVNAASEVGAGVRFSMEVLSDNPIVAERLMFSGTDVGDSIGSPTTAFVWNLAEGFTAFGFETWVIVSNPGSQTANITMDFLQQNGTTVTQNFALAPKRRLTVHVNTVPGIPGTSVSTQVTSDQPVVVERTMKFSGRLGIHQAMGVRQ